MKWPSLPIVVLAGSLCSLGRGAAEDAPASQPPQPVRLEAATTPDAAATAVLYNSASEESALLAKFYAQQRHIPEDQVIGLPCSAQEEITRREYDEQLAEPLRKTFTEKGWWKLRAPEDPLGPVESSRIRFLALMRGVPVKIAGMANYPGDKPKSDNAMASHNEAAVDSELATLSSRSKVISGALGNPYFKSLTGIRQVSRADLLLVCRLDGPSATVVRRMIVDGLAAERSGLRGFWYLDARGVEDPGLKEGDQWLYATAEDARKNGYPVILDNGPGMFPENYPMRSVAIYAGWYAEKAAGPFVRPGFRFLPGAVAVHIHSFSGSTVRDLKGNWVAPLLQDGAAATLGNVYEPYLAFTPHLDIFFQRLRMGFTFAEAAYMSQRAVSWMTTFVGDPLYRPFPTLPEQPETRSVVEWEAYRKGTLLYQKDPEEGLRELQDSARRLKSGIIWESLGLLQMGSEKRETSIESFAEAMKVYVNVEDILRAAIHQVIQLRAAGREGEAAQLARKVATAHGAAPAVSILRLLVPAAFSVN